MADKRFSTYSAASATQTQLCEHGRRMVEKIAPERDSTAIAAVIPRLLSAATPKPIYYYNYNVGECRDLIFGVSLVDYATARGLPEGEIPKIVRICIQDIEQRGLEAEGIYRVSHHAWESYSRLPIHIYDHRFRAGMRRYKRYVSSLCYEGPVAQIAL